MRRALRVLGYGLAALLAVGLLAAGAIRIRGGRIVRKYADLPAHPVTPATDSNVVSEGLRLARLRGCMGCHGSQLEGKVFFEEPFVARLTAPNLTVARERYTDAQLERVIRHGVRLSGESVFIMPSNMFYDLSDADLAAILGWLRSLPAAPDSAPSYRIGPLGWLGIASGKFVPIPDSMDHTAPRIPGWLEAGEAGGPVMQGRYLARTICTECHGMDLMGGDTPALTIVAGYSLDAFTTLMRTGVPLDGRELGLMKTVALSRFAHFTAQEVAALYAYLRTLATGRPA